MQRKHIKYLLKHTEHILYLSTLASGGSNDSEVVILMSETKNVKIDRKSLKLQFEVKKQLTRIATNNKWLILIMRWSRND